MQTAHGIVIEGKTWSMRIETRFPNELRPSLNHVMFVRRNNLTSSMMVQWHHIKTYTIQTLFLFLADEIFNNRCQCYEIIYLQIHV